MKRKYYNYVIENGLNFNHILNDSVKNMMNGVDSSQLLVRLNRIEERMIRLQTKLTESLTDNYVLRKELQKTRENGIIRQEVQAQA